jgi:NAD(P)-dependent dehydrogenase (short-subunit alcohol dehydrogenase family)
VETFTGKVAVVTGAASGLGRALACELAARGARVAICDNDRPGLEQTAQLLRRAQAYDEQVDVADRTAVHRFADNVHARFGVVHQVYNNAGVAHVGTLEDIEYAELERLFAVNFWGVVHGTKEFLPYLKDSQNGHVVNISSLFGMIAAPWMGGYDATKFAVRGFTEALRGEMRALRRPIRVTAVHPGGIRTQIVESAGSAPDVDKAAVERGFRRIAASSPEHAARVVLRGVARNKPRVLVGMDARAALLAERMIGVGYEPIAATAARWLVPSERTRRT